MPCLRELTCLLCISLLAGCAPPRCGDGRLDPGESCDEGAANADTGSCTTACVPSACGDGLLQRASDETCDDGNDDLLDGCALCVSTGNVFTVRYPVEECGTWLVGAAGGDLLTACTGFIVATPEDGADGRVVVTADELWEGGQILGVSSLIERGSELLVGLGQAGVRGPTAGLAVSAVTVEGEVRWTTRVSELVQDGSSTAFAATLLGDGTVVALIRAGADRAVLVRLDLEDGRVVAAREEGAEVLRDIGAVSGRVYGLSDESATGEARLFGVNASTLESSDIGALRPRGPWTRLRFEEAERTLWAVGGSQRGTVSGLQVAEVTPVGVTEVGWVPGATWLSPVHGGWLAGGPSSLALHAHTLDVHWNRNGIPLDLRGRGAVTGQDGFHYMLGEGLRHDPRFYVIVP
ncbi:MAG: DUF4215 domain-containing protein [Myxococcota bacterium]|nr:DUF4215 domain-containing protein [Myxococcota bacterium]